MAMIIKPLWEPDRALCVDLHLNPPGFYSPPLAAWIYSGNGSIGRAPWKGNTIPLI